MTTEKQLITNRDNAQKSTGPKTFEGKIASSQNAVKHGLFSREILLDEEKRGELQVLRDQLYSTFLLCRDFLHLNYVEACVKVGKERKDKHNSKNYVNKVFVPKAVSLPHEQWQQMAQKFTTRSHLSLIQNATALKFFILEDSI